MRVFVTNDDGIEAEGIECLARALSKANDVVVVAPDVERSAMSHALTVRTPIKYSSTDNIAGVESYKTNGTPADCVKFGLFHICKQMPDILVSGINAGPNLGTDVMYSGTVSAAFEGRYLGVKSIAVSIAKHRPSEEVTEFAARFIADNLAVFAAMDIPENTILNINFPHTLEVAGIKVTAMGIQEYDDVYVADANEVDLFWLKGKPVEHHKNVEDCDVEWSKKGYITISPVSYDMTDYKFLEKLRANGGELI